jgi:uncharacterized protein (DUF983 family)
MDNRTWLGIKRGLRHRCPNCGEGELFRKYLKVQPNCTACGHDNAQYPADDGPAYFTMLIIGHVVIAPVLVFPFIVEWPAHYVLLTVLPLLAAFTLWLLPRVKGGVIGLQWAIRENYRAAHGHYPVPPHS